MLLVGKDEDRKLTTVFGKFDRSHFSRVLKWGWGEKRRGGENVETATIGNYFEDFYYEGKQRMGQILEENVRLRERLV